LGFIHHLNFEGVWRFGGQLCFHLQVKREESPKLVNPLGTVILGYRGSTRFGASSRFTLRRK